MQLPSGGGYITYLGNSAASVQQLEKSVLVDLILLGAQSHTRHHTWRCVLRRREETRRGAINCRGSVGLGDDTRSSNAVWPWCNLQ